MKSVSVIFFFIAAIASSTVEISENDDERVKELKKLFNARDSDGFIKYWQQSGLSPDFQDSYGRGWMFWFVGANILADDVPIRIIAPINVYFAANHEAAINWDLKDFTGK